MIRECVTWAVLGNFACFLSADTFLKNTRVSNIFNSMDQDVLSDLILVQIVYNHIRVIVKIRQNSCPFNIL